MRRADLVPECGSCVALCCVVTSFERGPAFAFDKPAGVRCHNLTAAGDCGIHADLVASGCAGCAAFDCYGAGQRASALPAALSDGERAHAFFALRARHEQLWLLTEAAALLPRGHGLRDDIAAEVDRLDEGGELRSGVVRALLLRVGGAVRSRIGHAAARLRVLP